MVVSIIPKPNKSTLTGGSFLLTGGVTIIGLEQDNLRDQLARMIKLHTKLAIRDDAEQKMVFVKNLKLGREAYKLTVAYKSITIEGSHEIGYFYALMTLTQLFASNDSLDGIQIEDEPRYGHRGFLLDVSRHFICMDEIKRLLDLVSLFKMNVFHWHLTDDTGWRVEIKKYPELTKKGATRTRSITEKYGEKLEYYHSGFYTQDAIREVVQYAKDRYIEVIPEIDMPGHVQSALCAYPELMCRPRKLQVAVEPGISDEVLCLGNEFTYRFIFDVLDEISGLFPSARIHLGGDEVVKANWFSCPKCMDIVNKNNLHSGQELQTYFINKAAGHLKKLGRTAIVWNESIVDPVIDEDAICQFWNAFGDLEQIKNAFHSGHDLIDSNNKYYYLDYPNSVISLQKCYDYETSFEPSEGSGRLLGIEGAIWTEFISNSATLNRRMFPRFLAIAESAWTRKEFKDFGAFKSNVLKGGALLKTYGVELTPEEEWEVKGFRGFLMTVRHYKKMLRIDTLKKISQMQKEKKVRFNQ